MPTMRFSLVCAALLTAAPNLSQAVSCAKSESAGGGSFSVTCDMSDQSCCQKAGYNMVSQAPCCCMWTAPLFDLYTAVWFCRSLRGAVQASLAPTSS